MNKFGKRFLKIMAIVFGTFALLLFFSSILNIILLKIENKKIVPNGNLVNVNNHRLHVYSEGNINNKPTLVFMAGGGTATPVYDFKPLYSLLSDEYRIVVIEKIGYGYADIDNTNRDIDIMLEETRTALQSVGENAPFVLLPHSMSGLETLYWLSKYPEEIIGIIGLDMAVPESYDRLKGIQVGLKLQLGFFAFLTKTGLHRIPMLSSMIVNNSGLSTNEYRQAKYLAYRNFSNATVKNEVNSAFENAEKVKNTNYSNKNVSVLLFVSNGKELGDFWIPLQNEFASKMGAKLIQLDCGHYIHHFESPKIAEEIKKYLIGLSK